MTANLARLLKPRPGPRVRPSRATMRERLEWPRRRLEIVVRVAEVRERINKLLDEVEELALAA